MSSNNHHIRRISIFGAPCAGKSTLSMQLCADLKRNDYNAEFVPEHIKELAIRGIGIKGWDQLSIFTAQLNAEYARLSGNKNFIVTECPILMNAFYAEFYGCPGSKEMISLAKRFDTEFVSYNILLTPNFARYSPDNRYHSRPQAQYIHECLVEFLNKHLTPTGFFIAKYDEWHRVRQAVDEIAKTYGYRTKPSI